MPNGLRENFNGRLREELLNEILFRRCPTPARLSRAGGATATPADRTPGSAGQPRPNTPPPSPSRTSDLNRPDFHFMAGQTRGQYQERGRGGDQWNRRIALSAMSLAHLVASLNRATHQARAGKWMRLDNAEAPDHIQAMATMALIMKSARREIPVAGD
jgi:hypothetical protein